MIHQANATFDWLYDPSRNPDAGSMTGWLGDGSSSNSDGIEKRM